MHNIISKFNILKITKIYNPKEFLSVKNSGAAQLVGSGSEYFMIL